jgi:hypothetical protein
MGVRRLLFLEAALAVVFATAFVMTCLWPDWIERVVGVSPDQGNGETEWGVAAILGLCAVLCATLARRQWRRARRLGREAPNV